MKAAGRVRGAGGAWAAVLTALLLVVALGAAWAAAELPALTGRIVDGAGLLDPATRAPIETKLKTLEDKSGIQLVVATVKSLDGEDIEPYANRLFRAWKLGQAKQNNGVLLLVAPNEHKARIEVGYGLEGTLTDALSKLIITNALVPRFKAKDFQGGIAQGVDDIIAVLSTDAAEWKKRPDLKPVDDDDSFFFMLLPFMIVGVVILVIVMRRRSGGSGGMWIPTAASLVSNSGSSSSGSGGSSDDSGFSGGGGSSGGGGASGDW